MVNCLAWVCLSNKGVKLPPARSAPRAATPRVKRDPRSSRFASHTFSVRFSQTLFGQNLVVEAAGVA